jgi:A/G-specific adenine glycosylase
VAKLEEDAEKIAELRQFLLDWYERNGRELPWRKSTDPYSIWVSEIMLQQTRVAVVVERYQAFLARFPTLISLALAPVEEVLALWSGLGYYRRARMLHQAARFVAEHRAGNLPRLAEELRALPGIGAYTAAAVASIAFGEAVAVVDGNVERVLCRVAGWGAGSRMGGGAKLRRKIEDFAQRLLDPARASDFNQAMMDLGAIVCTPRSPQCLTCPLLEHCKTRGEHKTPRRAPMISRDVAYVLSVRTGPKRKRRHRTNSPEVLLEQRPANVTVMPGMWELPSLLVSNVPPGELRMTLRHSIMQVNYYVRIRTSAEGDVESMTVKGGKRRWVPVRQAESMALTGLTRKVLKRAHLLPGLQIGAVVP